MKLTRELECRVLTLVEAAQSGMDGAVARAMDFHTAAFRCWPGLSKAAARQLAAHANAARGHDLLWIVGLDAARSGAAATPGADFALFDDWLARVGEFFDGITPRVSGFRVPIGGGDKTKPRAVVALHVETGRAPFVIRGAASVNGKAPSMEVPWLEVNDSSRAIRAAGRLELVKLLSPLQDLPQFEILEAELTFYRNPHVSIASRATFRWSVDASVYVMPHGDSRIVIPLHRCRGGIRLDHSNFRSEAAEFNLTADQNSPAVRITESAALIEGLGRFFIFCSGSTNDPQPPLQQPASLLIDLTPAGFDRASMASAALRVEPPSESNQAGRWKL